MTKEQLAEKALDQSLSGFVDNLNEAMTVISQKLVTAAPEAAQLMLKALQLQAAGDLITSVLGAGFAFYLLTKVSPVQLKKAMDARDGEDLLPGIAAILSGVTGVLLVFGACLSILSTKTWIALFSPEAAIALKALDAIGVK